MGTDIDIAVVCPYRNRGGQDLHVTAAPYPEDPNQGTDVYFKTMEVTDDRNGFQYEIITEDYGRPDDDPRAWNFPRYYDLFYWLADVRWSRMIENPIKEPSGFPDNTMAGVLECVGDGYSKSLFTIEELVNFDYDRPCNSSPDAPTYRQALPDFWFKFLEAIQTRDAMFVYMSFS